jgi:glycine/D-amino acid oxidase-like deaminating enzyme
MSHPGRRPTRRSTQCGACWAPGDPAAEYAFHDREQAKARFSCAGADPEPVGAVSYAAGSISGHKFGVGVLKLAVQKGLNLQTHTPALSLGRCRDGSRRWQVSTPRGQVTAGKVVLATNGYTAHICKAFQGTIVPLRGQVAAQRPGHNMPGGGLPTTYSFIYEDGYDYIVPRPPGSRHQGDIVIGGGLFEGPHEDLFEYGTTDDTHA